jgi:two-component system response regulator NreC
MPIRILLADDHLLVRQGVKAILERNGFEVVGEASDGHQAIELARDLRPDVAILDFAMPLLNGIDAAREILKDCRTTRVILLTMHTEDQYILGAIKAGIRGFVVKSQVAEDSSISGWP